MNPATSHHQANKNEAQPAARDMLADAAQAVTVTPWPRIEEVSFVSRLAGARPEEDGVSRRDAVETYISGLQPQGARFSQLASDAGANLGAAGRLLGAAESALHAPRLSTTDIGAIEDAIQTLRANRQIYLNAARQLAKADEPVDDAKLDAIRDAYAQAIRDLGRAADALADRLAADRSESYAAPTRTPYSNLSGV